MSKKDQPDSVIGDATAGNLVAANSIVVHGDLNLRGSSVPEGLTTAIRNYLGGELQHAAASRSEQLDRIIENATKKIDRQGHVPLRVIKELWQEGTWLNYDLATEYFGGIFAASVSENRFDDRGATFAKLVSRLSLYQLRSHYLFYHVIKTVHGKSNLKLNWSSHRLQARVFIPLEVVSAALELSEAEDASVLFPHILDGLDREGLIAERHAWGVGRTNTIEKQTEGRVSQPGVIIEPSTHGIELFLWAHGLGEIRLIQFLDEEIQVSVDTKVDIRPGSIAIGEPPNGA